MVDLCLQHGLLDWVEFAQKLIKQRIFGIDQVVVKNDNPSQRLYVLNETNDFILYKDPKLLAKDEQTAKNSQLALFIDQNCMIKVEFLLPFNIKLKNVSQDYEQQYLDKESDEVHEHLEGYLSEEEVAE